VKKPNYVKIIKYPKSIYHSNRDMGSRLRVFLTPKQDKTLFDLRTADVPSKSER
jgi:hypothetical protein